MKLEKGNDMKLHRDKTDELVEIHKSILAYAVGFGGLPEQADSIEGVIRYRSLIEAKLRSLDKRMCKIMDDIQDMTTWASRMGGCRKHLRALTMNLAFAGRPEWSWDEIIAAMSYLEAISKAAESTLDLNESREGVAVPDPA